MALASLKYDNAPQIEETRQGIFIYDRDASRFHEWEFHTMMEINSVKKEDMNKNLNSIIKALFGEAAVIAMDMNVEKLLEPDGCKTLVESMRKLVFTNIRADSKELYRIGHQKKGILSRQLGESMTSHIGRRK